MRQLETVAAFSLLAVRIDYRYGAASNIVREHAVHRTSLRSSNLAIIGACVILASYGFFKASQEAGQAAIEILSIATTVIGAAILLYGGWPVPSDEPIHPEREPRKPRGFRRYGKDQ